MNKAMNVNDVAIVSIKRSNYQIRFWHIRKNDALNIIKKVDYYKFLLNIKDK